MKNKSEHVANEISSRMTYSTCDQLLNEDMCDLFLTMPETPDLDTFLW